MPRMAVTSLSISPMDTRGSACGVEVCFRYDHDSPTPHVFRSRSLFLSFHPSQEYALSIHKHAILRCRSHIHLSVSPHSLSLMLSRYRTLALVSHCVPAVNAGCRPVTRRPSLCFRYTSDRVPRLGASVRLCVCCRHRYADQHACVGAATSQRSVRVAAMDRRWSMTTPVTATATSSMHITGTCAAASGTGPVSAVTAPLMAQNKPSL